MLRKVLIAVAAIIVLFVAFIALQPSHFQVARSATIGASPSEVFAHVNDLRKWEAWSPWAKRDPNARMSYEGPAAGTGMVMAWAGNSEVGEGRMTVTESRPAELIRLRLDFVKPMAATSMAEFTFKPEGDRTAVTWSMSGENNFIARAICFFINGEKMIGGDFEKGLQALKRVTEAAIQ